MFRQGALVGSIAYEPRARTRATTMGGFAHLVSTALLIASAIGVAIVVASGPHARAPPRAPGAGAARAAADLDPEAAVRPRRSSSPTTWRCFAALPYPDYEVLLGVASAADPAYAVAAEAARRWPARFRVVIQRGAPGLNPKVNQLLGLVAAARADILVVSDSNTRVPPGYLDEIAAYLEDPTVGLVTHAIAGSGEERARAAAPTAIWGARLDNLHITGTMTPGLRRRERPVRQDLRRRQVHGDAPRATSRRWAGFDVVKDVLAEDFVLGRLIPQRAGQARGAGAGRGRVHHRAPLAGGVRVALRALERDAAPVRRPAAVSRSAAAEPGAAGDVSRSCWRRRAWSRPAWALCALTRALADSFAGRLARGRAFGVRSLLLVPLKELLDRRGLAARPREPLDRLALESPDRRRGSVLSLARPAWRASRRSGAARARARA